MKFRTEYEAKKSPLTLDPSNPVVLMGSCFSQNIAGVMNTFNWEAVNPGGTLYNPFSIGKAIELLLGESEGKEKFEGSLFEFNGIWNSRYFDSSFSAIVREDCLEEFAIRQQKCVMALEKGKTLIVTFGTSICYYLKSTKELVGNCHKQPSELFIRRRVSVEEISKYWDSLLKKLEGRIPGINLIFTLSPVRHLKDGFEGNSCSKSVLRLALEEICNKHSNCFYFPAYEIMMDDLRDYRFYSDDLLHPSGEGIEYIWEKFVGTYLNEFGLLRLKEGNRLYKAEHHRPKTGSLGKPLSSL